jgi:hypothetical protein
VALALTLVATAFTGGATADGVLSPACDRPCGNPNPNLLDPNAGAQNAAYAECVRQEGVCQAALTAYGTYMNQMGFAVTRRSLPQRYVDLLGPFYPHVNLANWRFGFGDRQPPGNATTDCNVTYFNDAAFVRRA